MREARYRVIDITCLLGASSCVTDRRRERAQCVSDLVAGLQFDGFVCVSCCNGKIDRAVRSVLECSRDFHCLPPEEKERSHHARPAHAAKVGGFFRKGEEPIYNEGELLYTPESCEGRAAATAATAITSELEHGENKTTNQIGVSYVEDFCVHLDLDLAGKAKRASSERKRDLNNNESEPSAGGGGGGGGAKENQVWPNEPQRFRRRVEEYTQIAAELGHALHGALVEGFHLRRYGFERSPSLVRLMAYPGGKKHGNISSHSDYEVFTLIHQQSPGLQVFQHGQWCWAPSTSCISHADDHSQEEIAEVASFQPCSSQPPLFVMLANDMLEFWTNGEVKATKHRVMNRASERARYSVVMFYAANEDVAATPLERYCRRENSSSTSTSSMSTRQALAKGKYCASYLAACSNAKTKIGSLTQGSHLNQRIAESLSLTERVLRKLRRGSLRSSAFKPRTSKRRKKK